MAIIIVLPFILLIRGAVYLHYNQGFSTYLSLTASAAMTAIILVLYFSLVYGKLTKKKTKISYLRRRFAISFFLVGLFTLNGIVFLSSDHAKTSDIDQEFSHLQPILRLGCSTLFLLDRDAIITDASRLPEDYKKMGLKTRNNSLHYQKEDGFAYALDLRTKNRSEVRNQILVGYFHLMGFNTIRHIGTADHLHVAMPCRY